MQIDDLNTTPDGTVEDTLRRESFVRLLLQSYQSIFGAILTLIPNRTDAEDAMQETCFTLWSEFSKFELGTNFRRWACSVAYNVARQHARQEGRYRRVQPLPDATLVKLSQVREATSELLELRRERLHRCLERLTAEERLFLKQCYAEGRTLAEIARQQCVSENVIYARLSRIRRRLYQCINHLMRQSQES